MDFELAPEDYRYHPPHPPRPIRANGVTIGHLLDYDHGAPPRVQAVGGDADIQARLDEWFERHKRAEQEALERRRRAFDLDIATAHRKARADARKALGLD